MTIATRTRCSARGVGAGQCDSEAVEHVAQPIRIVADETVYSPSDERVHRPNVVHGVGDDALPVLVAEAMTGSVRMVWSGERTSAPTEVAAYAMSPWYGL